MTSPFMLITGLPLDPGEIWGCYLNDLSEFRDFRMAETMPSETV